MGINGILPIAIYREFIPEGWKDNCESEVPEYIREKGEGDATEK